MTRHPFRSTVGRVFAVAALAVGLTLATWAQPASADLAPATAKDSDVPGYAVERVSALPANVLPGITIDATLSLSQTTTYALQCEPRVEFLKVTNTVGPIDAAVRLQDPLTGAWSDGVEESSPGDSQAFFYFKDFDLQPTQQWTANIQITFGPKTPAGYLWTTIDVSAVPENAAPGMSVLMESVRKLQSIWVGPPPTTDPAAVAAPPAGTRPRASPTVSPTATAAAGPTTAAPVPTTTAIAPTPGPSAKAPAVAADPSPRGGIPPARLVTAGAVLGATWTLLAAAYLRRAGRRRALWPTSRGDRGR